MTDTQYPEFIDLSEISRIYVYDLLQPYKNVLDTINTNDLNTIIELLNNWITLILPSNYSNDLQGKIRNIINNSKEIVDSTVVTEQIKTTILDYIINILIGYAEEYARDIYVTPWDLSKYRNELLINLFGGINNKINITVITPNNIYNHLLTEEFTYGLLIGLSYNPNFQVLYKNVIITHNSLDERYRDDGYIRPHYGALIHLTNGQNFTISFDTPDVIQGIVTACQWIKYDPHLIITDLNEFNDTGDTQIFLDF